MSAAVARLATNIVAEAMQAHTDYAKRGFNPGAQPSAKAALAAALRILAEASTPACGFELRTWADAVELAP